MELAQGNEARLSTHLLQNYQRVNMGGVARPILLPSESISVKFGVSLIKLLDVNEDTNVTTFITWERYVSIEHFHLLLNYLVLNVEQRFLTERVISVVIFMNDTSK